MSASPLHDWMRPRLASLVQEAVRAGNDPQVVLAVLSDLVETEDFASAGAPDAPGTAEGT